MNQALLDLAPQRSDTCDRTGFELGWDHAHHGLVPPPELMLDGTPISQGWCAGKAVFGRRTLAAPQHVRQWLALRLRAWRQGIAFETTQVTAHYVGQLAATQCPITRRPLGGIPGTPDAACIERLNVDAGYAAGNLAQISHAAATELQRHGTAEALRRAARIDAGIDEAPAGLDPAAAWRLAVLQSFVTALPFAQAARIPLRALPPNRVRVLNAVQGLQVLVTLQFAAPGWSARLRDVADRLPSAELRHDFNLFVGAFAPRLLQADTPTRQALEDAWACERVNRRWQQFVLALGEGALDLLLQRLADAGLAGVRAVVHPPAQATDGWSLASRGRVVSAPRRPLRPSAPHVASAPARG